MVSLAPVRHYVETQERVGAAKLQHDSFSLSIYPVFSENRRGRATIPHAVGFSAEGEGVMPHCTHLGAGGLDQVRKRTAQTVRAGRADRVAQRYADSLAAARCPTAARSCAEATCGSRGRNERIQHVEVVRNRSPRWACPASAGTASRLADAPFDAAQVANALVAIGLEHCVIRPLNCALQLWTCSSRIATVRSLQDRGWAAGRTLPEQIATDAVRKEVFGPTAPAMHAGAQDSFNDDPSPSPSARVDTQLR